MTTGIETKYVKMRTGYNAKIIVSNRKDKTASVTLKIDFAKLKDPITIEQAVQMIIDGLKVD